MQCEVKEKDKVKRFKILMLMIEHAETRKQDKVTKMQMQIWREMQVRKTGQAVDAYERYLTDRRTGSLITHWLAWK